MARKLPSFSAVRAFEAAARHLSFKQAADELCLSPSAISHQIRALETYLDTALFERQGNRLVLTLTGRGYAGKLTDLLDTFDESTRAVREAGSRPFRLLCTPGFAARWLVPRLDRLDFADRVRLRVSTGAPSTDFASNDADVVIQWSDSPIAGVRTDVLMTSNRYPVASPALQRRENIRTPEDLLRVTLMHDEVQDAWAEWFGAAGISPPAMPRGPVLPNCELATTAAERGQGVALAYNALVRDTLAEGRLVRLFDTVTMPIVIYSLACPEARADDPMIREFHDWIFAEVAADGTAPRRLGTPL
ncbi:LysR family transcriptional regulator, glycine cleavage system transcriptional activator [Roseovarius azorensis]|uniref:LysR family transcriptional regulator, glycine cleavage system transcriptional activator n=1 Tax=Roseovarius azorensis TaxID=1287727 RepID=A0A1H7GWW0_9RHOB|nr:LysR substrate-binding domain-containing protein [Roseovarius azorensis]SEK42548.1 LysR family transcriptional regulator, glycine cleavage system transcriptional activator [Roseovarius azorensis]